MANTGQIQIKINADGSAAISGITQVTGKLGEMGTKTQSLVQKMKANWLELSAAAYASWQAISKAWNMAEMSAQFEQSKQAFDSMVQSMGLNAEAEFNKIKQASAGLIDNKSLVEAANTAMSLGIPVEKLGDLMQIARAKARDMGITTSQAFSDISRGIGRASPMILDNLGLALKVGAANEAMAASIGKTVEELTDKEKKMAILNAVVDAGSEALDRHNLAIKTTNEKMQAMVATVKDLQILMGQGLIRAFAGLYGGVQWLTAGLLTLSAAFWKVTQAQFALLSAVTFGGLSKKFKDMADGAGEASRIAFEKAGEMAVKAVDNFKVMTASAEDLSKALAGNKDDVEELDAAAVKLAKTFRDMMQGESIARLTGVEKEMAQLSQWTQNMLLQYGQIESRKTAILMMQEQKRLDITKSFIQQRIASEKAGQALLAGLKGPADPIETYKATMSELANREYKAKQLPDIGAQIKELEQIRQEYAGLNKEVANGDRVFLSQAEAVQASTNMITGLNYEIEQLYKKQGEQAGLPKDILNLDNTQALQAIAQIQTQMDTIIAQTIQIDVNTEGATAKLQELVNKFKDIYVNVHFTGSGSEKLPISEKLNWMEGRFEQVTADQSMNVDMSSMTSAIAQYTQMTAQAARIFDVYQSNIARGFQATLGTEYYALMEAAAMMKNLIGGGAGPSMDAGSGGGVSFKGSYASGTSYVPETGLYQLHKGEAVIRAQDNRRSNTVININGYNKSPKELAEEIAKLQKNGRASAPIYKNSSGGGLRYGIN